MELTKNSSHWYHCDFETTTDLTKYYQDNLDVRVVLWNSINLLGEDNSRFGVSIEDWWEWLVSDGVSKTLFFFNLSFDGDFIVKFLVNKLHFSITNEKEVENKQFRVFRQGGKIFSIVINYQKRVNGVKKEMNFVIRCSYKILGGDVKRWGKVYGLNKYHGDEEDNKEEFYNQEPRNSIDEFDERFLEYCYNDNKIIKLALNDFRNLVINCDFIQEYLKIVCKGERVFEPLNYLTISSLTKKLMKIAAFMYIRNTKQKIKLPSIFNTNRDTYEYMTNYFRGGFTQFSKKFLNGDVQIGTNNLFIDVNSAYPAVMEDFLPYGELLNEPPKCDYCTFYEVNVKSVKIKPQFNNLYLLYNYDNQYVEKYEFHAIKQKNVKVKTKLRYLQSGGEGTIYLLKEEYEILHFFYEFEVKNIKSIYFKMQPFLHDYVGNIYPLKSKFKQEGNKAMESSVKVLLNAGYGCLAIRDHFDNFYYAKDINELMNVKGRNETYDIGDYKCFTVEAEIKDNHKCSNRATAAYITSKQRVKMLTFMASVEGINDKFMYADTDSLFFMNLTDEQYTTIKAQTNKELGGWGIEMERSQELFSMVFGAKKYVIGDNTNKKLLKSRFAGSRNDLWFTLDDLEQWFKSEMWIEDSGLIPIRCRSGILLKTQSKTIRRGEM